MSLPEPHNDAACITKMQYDETDLKDFIVDPTLCKQEMIEEPEAIEEHEGIIGDHINGNREYEGQTWMIPPKEETCPNETGLAAKPAKLKKRKPADDAAYDRAAESFKAFEGKKLRLFSQIRDALSTMSEAAARSAVAAERSAAALERLVELKEKKYNKTKNLT